MTFRDIDYILELAKTQNFNRAAENLFVAQPTLSYHIKSVEEELGFAIFLRSGRGAVLTPAGEQFCVSLGNIRRQIHTAIEQAQNFGTRYQENINVGLPMRSALFLLPRAMQELSRQAPQVSVTPVYSYAHSLELFLQRRSDLLFAMEENVKQLPDLVIHPLYVSRIYLIVPLEDPLADRKQISPQDLGGRTLMVGGGSPGPLQAVQRRVLALGTVNHFNSNDHQTTLTHVAAGRGICLAPGFLNDHSQEFRWVPVDCPEHFQCVLCTRKGERRPWVLKLIKILQDLYRDTSLPL